MAVAVVDALEAVEVDEQQADAVSRSRGLADGRIERLRQSSAIEQPGEAVPVRELLGLCLALLEQRDLRTRWALIERRRVDLGVDIPDEPASRHGGCRYIARSGDGIAVIDVSCSRSSWLISPVPQDG